MSWCAENIGALKEGQPNKTHGLPRLTRAPLALRIDCKNKQAIQQEMNTMKTNSDWHNIGFYERMCVCSCVCFWACLLTYVRHWYLWESVFWFRPDLWRQMHLPGGSKGMCVCVEEVGCNCGNSKQSLVLSSSFFPLARLTSRICLCACACVCLRLSPPVSNVQLSPINNSTDAYHLRWHLDGVQIIFF